MSKVLWRPTQETIDNANITRFIEYLRVRQGLSLADALELQSWSCANLEQFWRNLWNYYELGEELVDNTQVLKEVAPEGDRLNNSMMYSQFFPELEVNVAEILLRKTRDKPEIIRFYDENGTQTSLSGGELESRVVRFADYLRKSEIGVGDRVVAFMPNCPETVIGFLATISIGAIWSSCSPDFGVSATVDRFGQISPKLLIGCEAYHYGGKDHKTTNKLKEIITAVTSIKTLVVSGFLSKKPNLDEFRGENFPNDCSVVWIEDCLEKVLGGEKISGGGKVSDGGKVSGGEKPPGEKNALGEKNLSDEILSKKFPFNHPLLIAFSSGTTGVPKCIVHRSGGVILNLIKEHSLHCDIGEGDRVFYFTTCGWMMWNWLVGGLGVGASLMLYDGNPLPRNNPRLLFELAARDKWTFFGTSARYLSNLSQSVDEGMRELDLSSLRTIASTGSPLSPESFAYVYRSIKAEIHLASISGGTDIMGCFLIGTPTLPVCEGQLQMAALGMAVDIFDDVGESCQDSEETGELVCTRPFPSQPLGFWRDDGSKYFNAYYSKFKNVWHHGDFSSHIKGQGYIIHGRSDSTLNPSGVRIGSAEITRQVDSFNEIVESVAVGYDTAQDQIIIVFVLMVEGETLERELIKKIKTKIRTETTPRHVPFEIIQVNDLPRTRSGKISERAIRDVINNREIVNKNSLANPESLEQFADRISLAI